MNLTVSQIMELIDREIYIRDSVIVGYKAAAVAIREAEETAQPGVQADECETCGAIGKFADDECIECGTRR